MIVCSCNVLSDSRIKALLAGRAAPPRVIEVHHAMGCRPQCGSCARAILGLIREHQGCAEAASACIEADVAA